jgi:hypothetical protein
LEGNILRYEKYKKITHWFDHDTTIIDMLNKHKYSLVHENWKYGHAHSHVYNDIHHKFIIHEGIRCNRLEYEVFDVLTNWVGWIQHIRERRQEDPEYIAIMRRSRTFPFPGPPSKLKTCISPQIWKIVVNIMYCISTLKIPSRFSLFEDYLNEELYSEKFEKSLSENKLLVNSRLYDKGVYSRVLLEITKTYEPY